MWMVAVPRTVLSVGVEEGLSCVFSRAKWHRKARKLALPWLQHSVYGVCDFSVKILTGHTFLTNFHVPQPFHYCRSAIFPKELVQRLKICFVLIMRCCCWLNVLIDWLNDKRHVAILLPLFFCFPKYRLSSSTNARLRLFALEYHESSSLSGVEATEIWYDAGSGGRGECLLSLEPKHLV